MTSSSPSGAPAPAAFHRGERYAQERTGVQEKMALLGPRVIRDFMPEQHREFFAQLPFLLIGSLDRSGWPWASIITGAPGFMHTPDERTLQVRGMHIAAGDPLAANMHVGAKLGLLGIEPHTRRRNRANGVLRAREGMDLDIAIEQSFGNCPKYIQARRPQLLATSSLSPGAAIDASTLTPAMARMVREADTFFIATALARDDEQVAGAARHGADVSHRGGKPGFVRVDGDDTLTVPDFFGNSFFNTIGNLLLQPRAGLLFLDHAHGSLLYLGVTAEVIWEGEELAGFAGALRLLRFTVRKTRLLERALPLRWDEASLSPFLEATGQWR